MTAERFSLTGILLICALALLYCSSKIAAVLSETLPSIQPPAAQVKAQETEIVIPEPIIEQEIVEVMPVYEPEPAPTQPMIETDPVTPGATWKNITLPPVDISKSHGEEHDEIDTVRSCYEHPYYVMFFRERHTRYKFIYHILCQSESGAWFDRLLFKIENTWYEETGFMPRNGNWQEIEKWLSDKAVDRLRKLP